MEQIQALRFEVEEVGKHVKGSKKRFTWDISLKDKYHTIILDFSFISGKVKITVDRKILLENELPSNVSFQYPFTLEGFALNIIQQGETFELRINNKVFSHLYTQHKTNTEFKKYEEEVKDIKVNAGQFNAPKQKVQLNIGAFGNMKKKEKVGGGAEGWNAFSGGSFPNYFGEESTSSESKPAEQPKKKTNLLDSDEEDAPKQSSKVEAPKKEAESLLNDFNEAASSPQPSNESPFDMTGPSNPPKQPASEDFNTMQNLFSTMNVGNQSSGQMDFFASQQPKKEEQSVSSATNPSTGGSRIYDINHNNFATGVGMGNNATNGISFATSAPGSGGFDFSAFAKKQPTPQESSSPTMENLYSGQSGKQPSSVSSPLTDMSLNDFMGSKGKQSEISVSEISGGNSNVNANDFNTMQNLFQTSSGGFHQNILSNSTDQTSFTSANSFQAPFQQSPNENDFSTLQQMFQTSNYAPSSISASNPPQQQSQQQTQQQAPIDPFKKEKTDVFATMGGSKNPSFDFDMSSFGTMQAGSSQNQGGFDFFESKPAQKSSASNDNNLI